MNKVLTLQTYKRCGFPQLGHVLRVESSFHLGIEKLRVTILVLQLHVDFALEAVIFGEYRYHWN